MKYDELIAGVVALLFCVFFFYFIGYVTSLTV
jgi:hypothetical protein